MSAMYGDVLYGDVTPAGPDGLDSVISGGGNVEGSTVNANRVKVTFQLVLVNEQKIRNILV